MRIRKTFQGQLPANKILNNPSNSETDTYSCKYINESLVFEEQDPTVPEHVKNISEADIKKWNSGTGGGSIDINQIINQVYPIGSIFISTVNKNPGNIFLGTTWERFASGKTLIGVDEEDADFATVGLEGGSKDAVVVKHSHTVTGTAASAGAHTHTVRGTSAKTSGTPDGLCETWNDKTQDRNGSTESSGAHTHTVTGTAVEVGEAGTGKNLQPYITVFMWKRIA